MQLNRKTILGLFPAVMLVTALFAGASRADEVYSNISTDPLAPFRMDPTQTMNAMRGQDLAAKFVVTGSDYELSTIELGLSLPWGWEDTPLVVSVVEDASGRPAVGPTLDQIYLTTGTVTDSPQLVTATSTNRPRLAQGHTYWVTVAAENLLGGAAWHYNSTGDPGCAYSPDGVQWTVLTSQPAFAVRISGDAVAPPPNEPPVLTVASTVVVSTGTPITFTAKATDPNEGDTLVFSLGTGAPGSLDPASGVFTWTPTAAGTFDIAIAVTDAGGLSDTATVNVIVLPAAGNKAVSSLGTLPGYSGSVAGRINASGVSVGYAYNDVYEEYGPGEGYWTEADQRACVWQPGDTAPTELPLLDGYAYSRAWGINDANQIIGRSFILVYIGEYGYSYEVGQACVWELVDGAWKATGLGFLPATTHNDSDARMINALGQVVGESSEAQTENRESFIWDATNGMRPFTNLPEVTLPDGSKRPSIGLDAFGLGDTGLVLGRAMAEGGDSNGVVVWDSISQTTVGHRMDGEFMAVSPSGLVAGYGFHTDDLGQPIWNDRYLFTWNNGVTTDLGRPDASPPIAGAQWMDQDVYASMINDNGQVLVYTYTYWDYDGDGNTDYYWDLDGDGETEYAVSADSWRWSDGAYTNLATVIPAGVTGDVETGMMDAQGKVLGVIFGLDGEPPASATAFLWSGTGTAQLLPSLGGSWTLPLGINDAGLIVGQSAPANDRPAVACMWNELAPPTSVLNFSKATLTKTTSKKGTIVTITAKTSLTNPSAQAALNTYVKTATLGGIAPSTSLPLKVGTVRAGASKSFTLQFKNVPQGSATLSIEGTCSLGDFFSTQSVTVP